MANVLVAGRIVTRDGDDTLLLTHYLKTGTALPQARGNGRVVKAANTKRIAAQALQVAEADVPSVIDGSERLVAELACPPRGFTRAQFAEQRDKVNVVVAAYLNVGRAIAAEALQKWLTETTRGFEALDVEKAHLVKECLRADDGLATILQGCNVVVRTDPMGRPRILFNLGDAMLQPSAGYVSVVSGPGHRSRQISELLEKSKDLRQRWDERAPGSGLRRSGPRLFHA